MLKWVWGGGGGGGGVIKVLVTSLHIYISLQRAETPCQFHPKF